MHAHAHAYARANMHTHEDTCSHTQTHAHTRKRTYFTTAYIYARTHACVRACMHTYIYPHACIDTNVPHIYKFHPRTLHTSTPADGLKNAKTVLSDLQEVAVVLLVVGVAERGIAVGGVLLKMARKFQLGCSQRDKAKQDGLMQGCGGNDYCAICMIRPLLQKKLWKYSSFSSKLWQIRKATYRCQPIYSWSAKWNF